MDMKEDCLKFKEFIFYGCDKRNNYYKRMAAIVRIVRPIRWSIPGEIKDVNDERIVDMLDIRQDCPFHYMIEERYANKRKWRYNGAFKL